MLKIKKTMIIGRFNLVEDEIPSPQDGHYVRQFSREEINSIVHSGIDALQKGDEQ